MKDYVSCILITFLMFLQNVKQSTGSQFLNDFVNNELYLGSEKMYKNTTIRDCVWHEMNDTCSEDVSIILYASNRRKVFNPRDRNWLRKSAYDRRKENVVLIHGYASGDRDLPLTVLRKAYEKTSGYNLFLVDFSKLSHPPCYVSAVNNLRYISRCVSKYLNQLRRQGLYVDELTCVGHSLGAIICGLLKKHLRFQLNKIIGLDPAWPLVFGDLLSKRSARSVHVLQTNAGHYGTVRSIGHVNVCVNSGYIQPYCFGTRNPHLCSHIWSLCYMAQSLFQESPIIANKCSTLCPNFGIFKFLVMNDSSEKIKVINDVPPTASGTYCLDNSNPPYCPKFLHNGVGDDMCCQFV